MPFTSKKATDYADGIIGRAGVADDIVVKFDVVGDVAVFLR